MTRAKALKEAVIFLALTLGLSYFILWGPLALFQVPTISFVSGVKGPAWAIALFLLGGFVPSLVGLLLTALREGKAGLGRMGRSLMQVRLGWRCYLAAVGIAVFSGLAQILLARLRGQNFDFGLFAAQLGSFVPLIVLGPLSEELGWRGYAQERLQKAWSPILAGLAVGMVWALWHLPLFFMPGTSQHELHMPFLPFLLTLAAQSVVYAWLFVQTNGSIWSAVFYHWIYTYIMQVLATGIPQTPQAAWLGCIPHLLVAGVVAALWKAGWKSVNGLSGAD